MYENAVAGTVRMITKFEPKGGDMYANMMDELSKQNEQLAQEAAEAQKKAAELEA